MCDARDVKGYEGLYTVDRNGVIFSLKRGKTKKSVVFPNGYSYVNLHKNGKARSVRVHRIVAEAFLENPHGHEQVNHINGNKTDNRLSNLEWCNAFQNMKHAQTSGLFNVCGESNPSAKLTYKKVESIRKEYVRGSREYGTKALARKYGVSCVMIGKIVRNENWVDGFAAERSINRKEGDV